MWSLFHSDNFFPTDPDREIFSAKSSVYVLATKTLFVLCENFSPSSGNSRANEKNPRLPGNFWIFLGQKPKKTPFFGSFRSLVRPRGPFKVRKGVRSCSLTYSEEIGYFVANFGQIFFRVRLDWSAQGKIEVEVEVEVRLKFWKILLTSNFFREKRVFLGPKYTQNGSKGSGWSILGF